MKKKVLVVFGTRPEAIKMCPLVRAIKEREGIVSEVCLSGQHREMLSGVMSCFGVEADYDMNIMKKGQTLFDITGGVLSGIKEILEISRADMVLVHGDTSTSFAAALAAFYMGIPVGHVEAGLRTYNAQSPYPEEFNRQAISVISEYDFAPTERARLNLERAGKPSKRIFVTGNTVIDSFKYTLKDDYTSELLDWVGKSRLILLTAHRRENIGGPMRETFEAIKGAVERYSDVKLIYPVHMNPAVRCIARDAFGDHPRIRLIDPMGVLDFHNLLYRSYLILTDSGGVQEEAVALGKPTLLLRDTSERGEGVECGTVKIAGCKKETLLPLISEVLCDASVYASMSRVSDIYGDGRASERIADILESI